LSVPLARALVTGGGSLVAAPLVILDLETAEGVTGVSYVICYTTLALKPVVRLLNDIGVLLQGDTVAPAVIEQKLERRFRLLGLSGLVGLALSAVDMAAWDAFAKAAGLPLVRLLGGEPHPIPAYNSCGLGLMGPEKVGLEAVELVEGGFRAIKLRLGYPDWKTDLAAVRSVRAAVGPDILLPVDYNQCLTVPEAIQRGQRLDAEGLEWIEEPTRAADCEGHAAIAREVRTPIQLGENWWGSHEMNQSLAAHASELAMPDAGRIGGVSGWIRAAALAEGHGTPMSSHLYPEISAHLLAVTPTCHWLEYVDWANPILQEPVRVESGHVTPQETPGCGLAWDEDAVNKFLVS
jgi:mandelate racemase